MSRVPVVRSLPEVQARLEAHGVPRWTGEGLLSAEEAAAVLGIPPAEFRRDFVQGKRIPHVVLTPRRVRVRAQDLQAFVDGRTVPPGDEAGRRVLGDRR